MCLAKDNETKYPLKVESPRSAPEAASSEAMPINRLQLNFGVIIRDSSGVLITALAPVRTSDVVIQPFWSGINLIKWRTCVNTGKNQFSEIIDVRLR